MNWVSCAICDLSMEATVCMVVFGCLVGMVSRGYWKAKVVYPLCIVGQNGCIIVINRRFVIFIHGLFVENGLTNM